MLVFFVQKFNDIDHFTPVIYGIAKDTKEKIMILCLNPYYDISNDFRLRFLKERYQIHVDFLYNVYNPSIFYKIFHYLLLTPYSGNYLRNASDILRGRLNGERKNQEIVRYDLSYLTFGFFKSLIVRFKIVDLSIIKNHYGEKWVEKMIESLEPSVLIFDHAATNRIINVGAILKVSRRKGIPTISLPHGIPLFIEHSSDYDRAKEDYIKNECEYLVFQHRRWRDECLEYGLNPCRVWILGIARHCKEWENILQQIVPADPSLKEKGKGKLKVVYMDSGPDRYHEYKGIVQEAVERISKLEFVHFIYKPHTRRNIANLRIPDSTEVGKSINSVNLIKWADVVIGMHSSIMIEVLIQDKVYISPTYFRERKMIYEEYGACWMVDSHAELETALKRLNEDPSFRPYSMESVERFLTEVVYNGDKDKDVLGAHKEFILDIARGNMSH